MATARPIVPALVIVGLTCTGCLTEALWRGTETKTYVHTVSVPCKVLDARRVAETLDSSSEPGIAVQYEATPRPGAPAHIAQNAPGSPGWLVLRGAEDWRQLAGAERFVPEAWDLRVTNGDYFRRPTANARVSYRGTVPRTAIGEIVAPAELPPHLLSPTRILPPPTTEFGDEFRCIEAFHVHDWWHLLTDEPRPSEYEARPIAWLDPSGKPLARPPMAGTTSDGLFRPARIDQARCSLLGRVEDAFGEVTFVRVPVPVLLQGEELVLMRAGNDVVWRRTLVCPAELVSPRADLTALAAAPRFGMPLRGNAFDYRWGRELEEDQTLPYAWRAALTPITATLDAVFWTNPYLRRLIEYLMGEGFNPDPKGPGRR